MAYELTIIWDWLAFAVRWLHVITAIAMGSSSISSHWFGITPSARFAKGAWGRVASAWRWLLSYPQILVAPERMPEHLTWFKWESYSTWLSGAALLMIVYWAGGELYLIDASKTDLSLFQGDFDFGWIIGIWLDCL